MSRYWDQWAAQEEEWLAADDVPEQADIRVLNRADGTAPADVLQALHYLPALAPVLLPELSARRGLRLRAERLDCRPDAAPLFERSTARSAECRLAGLLPPARRTGQTPAAERSRFSILADDGGTFGQSVRHRSGDTRITAGSATVETARPVLPLAGQRLGPPGGPRPGGLPVRLHPGLAGLPGLRAQARNRRLRRPRRHPGRRLIFAGRAVVLDHVEGTRLAPCPGGTRRRGLARRRPAPPSRPNRGRRRQPAQPQRRRRQHRRRPRPAAPAFTAATPSRLQGKDRRGPARDRRGQHLRGLPHHRPHGRRAGGRRAGPLADVPGAAPAEPGAVRQLPALRRSSPWPARRRSVSCG